MSSQRNLTSLSNSELDSWLKSLRPELTVKVIDACHSGVPYVKGIQENISKYFEATKASFQKCIFMFSSARDQYSYQDKHLSHFTRAFVDAVKTSELSILRYREIIDFVTDHFANSLNTFSQTPFFVTQVTNTEVFCTPNPELHTITYPELPVPSNIQQQSFVGSSLKELIAEDEKAYISKEEAEGILRNWVTRITEYEYSVELADLYKIGVTQVANKTLEDEEVIGQWLLDSNGGFFAEPTYGAVTSSPPTSAALQINYIGQQYITTYEVSGFRHTADFPYKAIQVAAHRLHNNLPVFACTITYLPRMEKLVIFSMFATYRDKNWDELKLSDKSEWKWKLCSFGNFDEIWNVTEQILNEFDEYILERVKSMFDKSRQ